MQKVKYIAIAAVSFVMLFGIAIWHIILPDQETSRSERRTLAQAPALTAEGIFSGDYMEELETYLLDQFPGRDGWRTIKAVTRFDLFRQLDNNDVYLVDDSVLKMEYPLKEDQVAYAANKINEVVSTYVPSDRIYYSIVPDKNYFVAEEQGYPHMDYDRLVEIMTSTVNGQYLDIMDLLSVDDYYRTDTHWNQPEIVDVAQFLADGMGLGVSLTPEGGYTENTLSPFYGVYCGQSALPVEPDVLTYLTSDATNAASMTGVEFEGKWPVYTTTKFDGMDGYDVFAGGAQAVITMESPLAKTDRELVIFRDSYGSSISPLFLEGYSKVTLIDLRYIAAKLLPDFVELNENQDVLFLYSTSLLNSGMLLK